MFVGPLSSPDLNKTGFVKGFRRQSRRERKYPQRNSFLQFKVEYTILADTDHNQIPPQLSQQLQNMKYISSQNINKVGLPRRSSNLAKKLMQMKSIAKKQQQKYNGMIINSQNKIYTNEEYPNPLNIHEDDQISLKLENFHYQKENLDGFQIFNDSQQCNNQIIFYSNKQLEMNDEYNGYQNQNQNMDIESQETSRIDEQLNNYFN